MLWAVCGAGVDRGGGKTDGVLGEFGAHASRYGKDAIGLMVRPVGAQLMGGNGLIVSFGEVMPMPLGRLQRQSRRAFRASPALEVSTSELAGWCWAKQTLMESR